MTNKLTELAQRLRDYAENHVDCTTGQDELREMADDLAAIPFSLHPLTCEIEQAAFRKGWISCANWANRDDLKADIGSPAYLKSMAAAFSQI